MSSCYPCLKDKTLERIHQLDDMEDVFYATARNTRAYKKYHKLSKVLRVQLAACKMHKGKNKVLALRVKRTISKAAREMSKCVNEMDAWYFQGQGLIDDTTLLEVEEDE